jgi:type I restriction enzyme R subunit
MIIDRLTHHGVMQAGPFYEPPFTSVHYEGLDGVFSGSEGDDLLGSLAAVNQPVAA